MRWSRAHYKTMETEIVYTVSKRGGQPSGLRDRIVRTAERMFMSSGFVRVTSDDLAHEVGISKRTLYSVFRSKDEILQAVVRATMEETMKKVEAATGDPDLNFVKRFAAVGNVLAGTLGRITPVFLDDMRRSAPEVWNEIQAFRREKIMKYGRGLFEAGRREGYFRDDLDLDLVLGMFIGLIEAFVAPEAVLSSGLAPAEVLRTVFAVFFNGVLTGKGRRKERRGSFFTRKTWKESK